MCILYEVFDVINCNVSQGSRRPRVRSEFFMCLMTLPLMEMDPRRSTSSLVTCSDASEDGGGIGYAPKLSDRGVATLGKHNDAWEVSGSRLSP